jgi:uncharacterized protein (TIRG00374 family)
LKRSLRAALGILISLGFIWFALRGQDFGRIRTALGEVHYWWLLPALVVYFTGIAIRAYRWSILLRPMKRLSLREILPITAVGYMTNNILPLRTGEVVRSYVLFKQSGIRKTSALATIAIERIVDGITLLFFILISMIFVSFTSYLRHIAIIAFAVFAVAVIGLFLLTLGGTFRDRLLQIILGPLPTSVADKVEKMTESFLGGLAVMKSKRDLGLVGICSIAAWTCEASTYFLISRGFPSELTSKMGPAATLLTTGVGNLATLVPSGPGYVGTFETGIQAVLNGALKIPLEMSFSYAIVLHAFLYFPVTIWGGFEWWRMHLSVAQIRGIEDEADASPQPEPEPTSIYQRDPA